MELKIKKIIEKGFKNLTLDIKKNVPKSYHLCMIHIYTGEVQNRYRVDSVDTTKEGTIVTYVEIENLKQAQEYAEIVNKIINEYNEKYNENIMKLRLKGEE